MSSCWSRRKPAAPGQTCQSPPCCGGGLASQVLRVQGELGCWVLPQKPDRTAVQRLTASRLHSWPRAFSSSTVSSCSPVLFVFVCATCFARGFSCTRSTCRDALAGWRLKPVGQFLSWFAIQAGPLSTAHVATTCFASRISCTVIQRCFWQSTLCHGLLLPPVPGFAGGGHQSQDHPAKNLASRRVGALSIR